MRTIFHFRKLSICCISFTSQCHNAFYRAGVCQEFSLKFKFCISLVATATRKFGMNTQTAILGVIRTGKGSSCYGNSVIDIPGIPIHGKIHSQRQSASSGVSQLKIIFIFFNFLLIKLI